MARSRNIKPGLFANEDLAECEPLARILFTGLWCLSDREGRLEDRPKRIRAEVLPYDICDADQLLNQLKDHGFILRYQNGDDHYIQVLNFTKHQMPHHKEIASIIPAPEGMPTITRHPYNVPDQTRSAVFKRDGNACLKCGSTEALSIDHVMPLSKGGNNEIGNLQTLCSRCNSSKGDSTKDYRKDGDEVTKSEEQTNDDPTLEQRQSNDDSTMLRVAPLIPDSGFLIPDSGFLGSSSSGNATSVGEEEIPPPPQTRPPIPEPSPQVQRIGLVCRLLRSKGVMCSPGQFQGKYQGLENYSDDDFYLAVQTLKDRGELSISIALVALVLGDMDKQRKQPKFKYSPRTATGAGRAQQLAEQNSAAFSEARKMIFGEEGAA